MEYKWTNVNDELPKETREKGLSSDAVLVCSGVLPKNRLVWKEAVYRRCGKWCYFKSNEEVQNSDRITHWTSLPVPPDGE